MTLVLALDLDGVLYPFPQAFAGWADAAGVGSFPVDPGCRDYWLELGLDTDDWLAHLSAFGEADGYRLEAPYPEALAGVEALFDAGFDLLAVSSRPASRAVEASTYGWVGDWMLPLRAVLLGPNAKLEAECDLLVDDDPAALAAVDDLGEAAGVLLDRPWNRDADGPRASWAELPALVVALADAVAGVDSGERKWALKDALESFF